MVKNTFLIVVAALLTAQSHAQNILVNGSFESPSLAPNSILQTTPLSWLGENPRVLVNGDYAPGIPLPQDCQQFGVLQRLVKWAGVGQIRVRAEYGAAIGCVRQERPA